jgi:riboflavin kinase / FMN adenylyltransferase
LIHTHSLNEVRLQNAWLTIGVFDGVHTGHRALLRRLVDGAHAAGSPAVVLTFHPHPAVVLGGRADFKCLTTPEERADLLAALGVDAVITQEFTPVFAQQTADEFMRLLSKAMSLRCLLIGYDFALGRGREGNAHRIQELGQTLGYRVEVAEPVHGGNGIISSTAIRSLVRQGDVAQAAGPLGRLYSLSGLVVHGDGRGRRINLPTANITCPPEKLIPANGIYAAWAWVRNTRIASATNIGINPTYTPDKTTSNVEAHLLDFKQDLYGQELKLEFVARLRDEQKFSSTEDLLAQIHSDIEQTREVLGRT